jgi:hypothetical protein
MRLGLGLSIYYSANSGAGGSLGQTIALNHYNRVTAAGGVLPCGVASLAAIINAICTALGLTTEAQFQAAVPQGLDPHYSGYLAGAGSGVTLGQACQKIFNWAGASGDVSQGTAGSQPLLLAHTSGNNYWFGSGVSGNNVTTNATISPSTQVELSLYIIAAPTNAGATAFTNVLLSNDGVARNFVLNFSDLTTGIIRLRCGTPFTEFDSTIGLGNVSNYTGWIRASYNQNGLNGDVKFYTSNDSQSTSYNSINWTQLGATVTKVSSGLQVGVSSLQVGSTQGISNYQGKIARAIISNTIGGSPVVDFNPNTYNAATSQTNWTSTTGEVWTLNVGTATTGYKACIVSKTIVMGDGTDDRMASGTITSRQYFTSFAAQKLFLFNASDKPIYSGSTDSHILYGNTSLYLFNGAILASGNTSTLLNISTVDFNNTSSKIRVNAGADVSGAGGTKTSTTLNIFSYSSTYGNATLSTLIQLSSIATDPQKSAMYEILKSMNGL